MEYSEACIQLAILIKEGVFDYVDVDGLAIQLFMSHIENDETPRMVLALVKQELIEKP